MITSPPLICRLLHNVKSTMKILSNFVAFLENMNFIKNRGQKKNFSRSKRTFFRQQFFQRHQFTVVWTFFLQLRNFFGGFHEDFYPLIYHSQRPKLSIKHLIGPKVITLIDCKVHLHKIHREHKKIQRFQVDPQFTRKLLGKV